MLIIRIDLSENGTKKKQNKSHKKKQEHTMKMIFQIATIYYHIKAYDGLWFYI